MIISTESSLLNSQLNRKQQVWFVFIGLIGSFWLWFATFRHGIGISPDSVGYMAVAENLLKGKGFISYNGELFIVQPPMYPIAIAAFSFFSGLSPVKSTLLLNLLLLPLTTYVSGKLAFLIYKIIFSITTRLFFNSIWSTNKYVFTYAWSEPLFIFLLTFALLYMVKFIDSDKKKYLVICSISVGFLTTTRYVGIFIIIAFLMLLLLAIEKKVIKRRNEIYLFLFISSSPICFWAVRNYNLSGSFFGRSNRSLYGIGEHAFGFSEAITSWFILPVNYFQNKILIFLIAIALLSSILSITALNHGKNLKTLALIILVYVYSLFLFITCVNTQTDLIGNRLLSPIFIPLAIVLLDLFYHRIYIRVVNKIPKKMHFLPTALSYVIWFTYPIVFTLALGLESYREGLGYHATHWQQSETIAYARQAHKHLVQLPIYTNQPEAVYFFAQIQAGRLRCVQSNLIAYTSDPTWLEAEQVYLICFKEDYLSDCLGTLKSAYNPNINLIAEFSDGAIYLMTRRKI
jgi:hypothetical protein